MFITSEAWTAPIFDQEPANTQERLPPATGAGSAARCEADSIDDQVVALRADNEELRKKLDDLLAAVKPKAAAAG